MPAELISFSRLPHTPALLKDYLYQFNRTRRFYGANPHDWDGLCAAARAREFSGERRSAVVEVLREQNRAWGGDSQVEENLRRLGEPGTVAVVTGQQVGLFGGPSYSVYKALSAIALAGRLTGEGIAAVPVFWLASDDHDFEEVNHCTLLTSPGRLELLRDPTQSSDHSPVGQVRFGEGIEGLRQRVVDLWPPPERDQIRSWLAGYTRGVTYAEGFARLWQQLFRGRGLILLDPNHPRLRRLAAPVFRRTLEEAEDLDRRVRMRARELRQAGYHVQVRLRENATFLFLLEDGERQALRRRRDGFWLAGAGTKSREGLLSELEAAPERFSSNVLLRPVVQDWLLPTAAVVAGPNEITYLAQASVLYDALLGWMPVILPRASFTLIEAKVARLLGRYRLEFADVLAGRAELRARMAVRHLPPQLQSRLERTEKKLESLLSELSAEVAKLDPTLRGAVKTSERKMLYQYEKIRRKAARAQGERTAILDRHLEVVMNSLYPEGGLQERSINFLSLLARAGRDLVSRLLESTSFPCWDHQVISL